MEFKYKVIIPPYVELGDISTFLPDNFSVETENGDIFLTIQYDSVVSREDAYADLQQEIDRILFLTQIHIDFSLEEIKNDDESRTGFSTIGSCVNLAAKVNLLFQIIEIDHPDNASYPEYKNLESPEEDPIDFPHPMTESRLLRNLMSHGKGEPKSIQLKKYCDFNGFTTTHDPADQGFLSKVQERLPVLEKQAKEIIDRKISRLQAS